MRKLIILSIVVIALGGCATILPPSPDTIAKADYGTFPENYKELAQKWINETFFDPYSVRDLEISYPTKTFIRVPFDKTYYGYMIKVTCNAKNRMGGYVGKKTMNLFICNGVIMRQWEDGATFY